jgi:hypothetical protein
MFLMHKPTESLVEVLNPIDLFDPCLKEIVARSHSGQEMQDPEAYLKAELVFPSGEPLPVCWINPHYRDIVVPGRPMAATA